MLAIDWFPHNLLISQVSFSIAAALIIVKTIGHATSFTVLLRSKIMFCVVICGATLAGTIPTLISIQSHKPTFHPSISFKAYVAVGHQKDAVFAGIKWLDGFYDIRLLVDDIVEYPIQNLDLTVQVLDKSGDILGGMGQLSDIHGVEFHKRDMVPDTIIRLRGIDGKPYGFSMRDFELGAAFPVSDQWTVFCPRLFTDELRLVVSALHAEPDDTGKRAPHKLRLFGRYEGGLETSKAVTFDKILEVGN